MDLSHIETNDFVLAIVTNLIVLHQFDRVLINVFFRNSLKMCFRCFVVMCPRIYDKFIVALLSTTPRNIEDTRTYT
jgi:hypothetical protein